MSKINRILCIEYHQDTCELLKIVFKNEGYTLIECETPEHGLELAKQNRYSAIILEFRLPRLSGIEICRQIRQFDSTTPIIFFSASVFPAERAAGLAAGADAYLVKPNNFGNLAKTVLSLIEKKSSTDQV